MLICFLQDDTRHTISSRRSKKCFSPGINQQNIKIIVSWQIKLCKDMPSTKEFLGVVMFADISGFTALTEKYSAMATADGTSGTDKLSATLNAYIGKIVDEIINRKGDVLKFAGDAILATWKCSDIGHNAKSLLNKVINCSIDIQANCDNFMTEVGIVLRVKLAIAVGGMCLTNVGLPPAKQFDISGSAVDDVGATEKQAIPGSVILSQLAWANCEQSLFSATPLENGTYFKLIGHAQQGTSTETNNQTNENNVAIILQTSERMVTSALDYLIDQCTDYTQDMPKALLLDEDEKVTTGRFLAKNAMTGTNAKEKRRKKFERLTMTSNLSPQEVQNLRAYVPEPVLHKLDHGQDLEWLSEMRQVSVLFINMQLPTTPTEGSKVLQKAFEVVYDACTRYKGNLNKVFGFDKGCTFVVIFGLPGQKHEDDPSRAVQCAHHIFDSLHAIQEIVNESIGVTTGLAFCGVVGHKDRHEYTVIGSKVNMAARLMMYYPGLLTCDAETFEGAKTRLRKQDFTPLPYIELKGMKDPGVVREYNPNSSKKDEQDIVVYPMLGRKQEMRVWRELMKKQKVGSLHRSEVVIIEGEAGIGKTKLLEEFMDDAEKCHMRVIHAEGDVSHAQSTYYIVNTLMRAFFDVEGESREKYIMSIINEDAEITENIGLLSDIISTYIATTPNIMDVQENERQEKHKYILTKLLNLVVSEQNSVIAVDNARYIDAKSWELLEYWTQTVNTTFIFSIRTLASSGQLCESAVRLIENTDSKLHLRLTGLQSEHIPDLMCQLLEVNEVPKKLCEIVQIKSQGVPSWCEQLIKDMVDSNTIQFVARSSCLPLNTQKNLSRFEIPLINTHDYLSSEEMGCIKENERVATPSLSPSQMQLRRQGKTRKESDASGKRLSICKSNFSKIQSVSSSFVYDEENYIKASPGVMPQETDEVCVIPQHIDLKKMLVPDSMKDMVLARIDRMSLHEQTILKCAAVLGQSFTRDLLNAIIPKNCINMLDTTLYNLCKQKIFECGSLAIISSQNRNQSTYDFQHQENITAPSKPQHHYHHHVMTGIHKTQVLCGCYAYEGYAVINLSQSNAFSDNKKRICLYLQFSNSFVQEAAYALWLEDQRRALHERAAVYLEQQSQKCRSCGGDGFIPGYGRGISASEQIKNGKTRKFSVSHSQRSGSRSFSLFNENKRYIASQNTLEEALKLRNKSKAEHLKNYEPTGYRGESIGLALIAMARLLAESQENRQLESQKNFRTFTKRVNRIHPSQTIGKLATKALLMEFKQSSILSGASSSQKTRKASTFVENCNIDLSHCQCAQIQALVLPKLVYYLKAAGNLMKTFHYTIDAASAELNVNKSMNCLTLLEDVDRMIRQQEGSNYQGFLVTDEDRAKVECLKGQALCKMDCLDEGIQHFHNALKLLNTPQPSSKFGVLMRTWKASLVQTLHQKMPGVFTDNKSEETEFSVEQVRCLSFLSKAYHMKKDYARAYLANLEQLNMAEEVCGEFWNEMMVAYTDIITSCQINGNFNLGKVYEQMAKEKAKSASINVEDMLTVGQFHLTCASFHLANGDINNALNAGTDCYKIAKGLTDANMKIHIIPVLAHMYLLKLRAQSCSEILKEMMPLVLKIEDHQAKWIYYSCCVDLLLDTGMTMYPLEEITKFAETPEESTVNDFLKKYLNMALTLWYVRHNRWSEAGSHFQDYSDWDIETTYQTFQSRFLSISAEYYLHCFRLNPTTQRKNAVQKAINKFKIHMRCKGLFQARLYHLQAYFAYLKGKSNRAKLLLEDSVVASKNNDVSFDLEWAMASKATWFNDQSEEIELEPLMSRSSKYILPRIQ
ncbi:adenylate cyclase type 10-like isoform X2 [Hydractinia symbiolongicarpus]|uniref:adenylate cyclase type 10-like isoform X2 n=1 Tax=Hydractinia symbiolongicarpus TaxID=13093 RepID=UPI00254CA522|nr:adenylate cyclase type 10-like isoform X2 [Hydractinia symbiolongicarpus]